jgi:hypothetical protein
MTVTEAQALRTGSGSLPHAPASGTARLALALAVAASCQPHTFFPLLVGMKSSRYASGQHAPGPAGML